MLRVILLKILLVFSFSVNASFWSSPADVEDISVFWNGYNQIFSFKFSAPLTKEDGSALPACPATTINRVVSGYNKTMNIGNSTKVALATNAMNVGQKVKFYLNTKCTGDLGLGVVGVKLLK